LKTYKTKIIKGVYATEVRVDGDILYFVNHKEDNTSDSIIYLNLKENGF
jgi:ribosomal protein L24E